MSNNMNTSNIFVTPVDEYCIDYRAKNNNNNKNIQASTNDCKERVYINDNKPYYKNNRIKLKDYNDYNNNDLYEEKPKKRVFIATILLIFALLLTAFLSSKIDDKVYQVVNNMNVNTIENSSEVGDIIS